MNFQNPSPYLRVVVGFLVVVVVVMGGGFLVVDVVVVVVVVVLGRLLGIKAGRSTTTDSATTPSSNCSGSSSQINSSCGFRSTWVTNLLLYFLGGLSTWRRRERLAAAAVGVRDRMGAAVGAAAAALIEPRARVGAATAAAGAATGMPALTCRISVGAACRQFSQSSSTNLRKVHRLVL